MIDTADRRFFNALRQACAETDNLDEACIAAVERASKSEDVTDLRAARMAIDALDDKTKDAILKRAHRFMAMDISAIWNELPHANKGQRTN